MSNPTQPLRARGRRGLALGLGALLVVAALLAAVFVTQREDGPVRVMVVGDSLSHGMPGDHTWRYWAARQLAEEQVAFRYVGPYTGTYDFYADPRVDATCPVPADGALDPAATDGPYGAPFPDGVGTAHAARWGQTLARALGSVPGQVGPARPDVVVIELGFNDLHYGTRWELTQDRLQSLVAAVRAHAPEADIVLTTVPLVAPAAGNPDNRATTRLYNEDLSRFAQRLTTDASRVVVADLAGGYDSATMTWDGTHPNAAGEQQLARSVLAALGQVGVGPGRWTLPGPVAEDRPLEPPALTAVPGPHGVDLTWTHVPGATAYRIASKTADDPAEPRPLPSAVLDDHFTDQGLPAGTRMVYTVTAIRGTTVGAASEPQQVTAGAATPLVCPSGASPTSSPAS
ncbi:MAG: GDSL-type esterase/lipase family protein [Micrococcales bacterium]|nr:GDSL-type esterase/lipase family protein [Micrococcales bacterium]